jgi:hypothetical protein
MSDEIVDMELIGGVQRCQIHYPCIEDAVAATVDNTPSKKSSQTFITLR